MWIIRRAANWSGVGIVVSSWKDLAVTVDGQVVQHSPALDIHNDRNDLGNAIPWMPSEWNLLYDNTWWPSATNSIPQVLSQADNSAAILPVDIFCMIIYYTDWRTHVNTLPLVSRLVRFIALAHPRIGNHILLGHDKYTLATLARIDEPRAPYRLVGTFQPPRKATVDELQKSKDLLGLGPAGRSLYGLKSELDLQIGVQVVHGSTYIIYASNPISLALAAQKCIARGADFKRRYSLSLSHLTSVNQLPALQYIHEKNNNDFSLEAIFVKVTRLMSP
ncbi:hypothetical protein BDV93DRAFT_570502 [Ceratobasidium sp. AG-I]|nr:hypothetical protein BDV93DRAFT_570502 [Ceratobasidium sp. AG-I]